EAGKSKVLVFSDEIARMRNKDCLLRLVTAKINALFGIEEFGILKVDDDGRTYSYFMTDLGEAIVRDPDFEQISKAKYRVNNPVFRSIVEIGRASCRERVEVAVAAGSVKRNV